MSAEENKRLVRRLVEEAVARRNPDVVDEIATGEFARAAKRWVSPFRSAFPDFQMEIVELVAEGDTVVGHFRCSGTHRGEWLGLPTTGPPLRGRRRDLHLPRPRREALLGRRRRGQPDAHASTRHPRRNLVCPPTMGRTSPPFRIRFRVPLTVIPLVSGVAVAAALWNRQAKIEFFTAATHVLAIGAVGMALTGQFFRLGRHLDQGIAGTYVLINVLGVLLGTGLGLFFSFHALANGHSETPDLAVTAGALASGIVAFGVQALFGTPGMRDEEPEGAAPVPEPD